MFCINVWLTVTLPEDVDHVRTSLASMAEGVRREPGAERFVVYQSEAEPNRFLLNEHWQSKDDWQVHRNGTMFKEIYEPEVLPRVVREAHISTVVG